MPVCDVVVVGAGPGGYVAAIRAAQHGKRVTIVDAGSVGGTCLNVGCIPSKALIETAHVYLQAKAATRFGVQTGQVSLDFRAMMDRQAALVRGLTAGVAQLLAANGVTVMQGVARLAGSGRIAVAAAADEIAVEAKHILWATGSRPIVPPIPGLAENAYTTDTIWSLQQQPSSLIIIGGGAIGVELASFFNAIGTKVTLMEMLPRVLPAADGRMADLLVGVLRREGVEILTDSRVEAVEKVGPGEFVASVATPGGTRVVKADCVLVAVGRSPRIDREEMERAGIAVGPHGIRIDERFATTAPGVYAIGDVTGGGLAHVASAQAVACMDGLFGDGAHFTPAYVPSVVYSLPELAWVGLSEEGARAQGVDFAVSTFPYSALGRAHTLGAPTGEIKLISAPDGGRILGLHIFGSQASELIHEGVLALRFGLTARDLSHVVHAHPSLSEGIMEAAYGADLGSIHMFRRRNPGL